MNEPMSKPTFTQRAQAVLRDPRAGLLPAPLKSLFTDMAAALDDHQRRFDLKDAIEKYSR